MHISQAWVGPTTMACTLSSALGRAQVFIRWDGDGRNETGFLYKRKPCCISLKASHESEDARKANVSAYSEIKEGRSSSLEAKGNTVNIFSSGTPKVKMCGITNAHDAMLAAKAGAHFIGMILWPKSKRSVPLHVAKEIVAAAVDYGAQPVGVFVDENANLIQETCDTLGINIAQLHGNGSREAFDDLPGSVKVIYVLHADARGQIQTIPPSLNCQHLCDWFLIDGMEGGSGKTFEWENFQLPSALNVQEWFLAGGLNSYNVAAAISLIRPPAVDVSSGIAGLDGIKKDEAKVIAFMNAVHNWREAKDHVS